MAGSSASPGSLAPLLKVLLVLPYEPAAFMKADVAILDRHFELDTVIHNRGKARLFAGICAGSCSLVPTCC